MSDHSFFIQYKTGIWKLVAVEQGDRCTLFSPSEIMSDNSSFFIQFKIGIWKDAAVEEGGQIIYFMLLSLQC